MRELPNGDWLCSVCKARYGEVLPNDLSPFEIEKPREELPPVAIFPGSFNPWHEGHQDVLDKALAIFHKVIILQTQNSKKGQSTPLLVAIEKYPGLKWRLAAEIEKGRVVIYEMQGFLTDSIRRVEEVEKVKITAVVRGLRNGYDLQTEMVQQYWYEDLKMTTPIVYIITDRKHAHISSSAIREVEGLQEQFRKPETQ
jgi:pantetheine-phosphate adenylyltransferase